MRGSTRSSEHGATAVFVIFSLVVLGGFLALALNVGHMLAVRGEIQNATDSGALAGAKDLNATSAGIDAALVSAPLYANYHKTDVGTAMGVAASDVVVGSWNPTTGVFTSYTVANAKAAANVGKINAVQVSAGRQQTRGNQLPVFFGTFLGGQTGTDVAARAWAVRGGPCNSSCDLPIAVSDCGLLDANGNFVTGVCGSTMTLTFGPSTTDNLGLTTLGLSSNVSTQTVDQAFQDIFNGTCFVNHPGDVIALSNGQNALASNALRTDWNSVIGTTYTAPVIHIACPPQFVQSATIVGTVSITITQVKSTGNPKYLTARIECPSTSTRFAGGCFYYGTWGLPRLVTPTNP
jgi:Flp pilus assembly protein TadG